MYRYLLLIISVLFTNITFAQKKNLKTEVFSVSGTCTMCKERIETTVLNNKAYTADWDISTHLLSVSFDSIKTNKKALQRKIATSGHDTEDFKATNEAYNNLPECCHYDRINNTIPQIKNSQIITGVVLEESVKGKLNPISNATIKSLHTNEFFVTDSTGVFHINSEVPTQLAVSYAGYKTDTVSITTAGMVTIILKNAVSGTLKEVIVTSRIPSTYVSTRSTFNTLNLGAKELTKAACCNLSESFETSPSVDVSYSDAVTGMKQIQLLGLAGNYTQLLTETVPEIKGLSGSYGLTFVPGPWIEGIQLTKGTGSVINGYESIAGQINIEEKKPDNAEKLFLNTYVNNMGRLEGSLNLSTKLNHKWSTALLTHANGVALKNDQNNDSFLDIPLGRQYNVINRWKYMDNNGWIVQFAIKMLSDKRQAGQKNFDPDKDKLTTKHYGAGIQAEQYTFTGKAGYIFPRHKYKSIGIIFSGNQFSNDSYYGLTKYTGKQKSIYANLIYQSIIGTTAHKFRTGFSFVNDNYNESFNKSSYKRNEIIPGVFFEYTYTAPKKFSAILGIRADHHNQFGYITTPRINLKYDFTPKTNLRFSAGSGFRMANIFAENAGVFVSARQYAILEPSNNFGYGLNPERAWNYGINFIHNFKLNNRSGSFSIDAYRTNFNNQIVIDLDKSPQQINFYNLKGKSFSNSLQVELNYELIKKLDLRMAYRWLDVQTNYHGQMLEKPFTAKHRAFINLAYETQNKWKFDYTLQWLSHKRIPNTLSNPPSLQMPAYSPSYFQMAAQISKLFDKWDIYLGSENITGYMQKNLIIDTANPFSNYFDGSMIWGPISGRTIYAGLRFRIK